MKSCAQIIASFIQFVNYIFNNNTTFCILDVSCLYMTSRTKRRLHGMMFPVTFDNKNPTKF